MSSNTERPFQFELIVPPADLRDQINTFFWMRTELEQFEEVMPAYSAQLHVFLEGSATMHFEGGSQDLPDRVIFNAPLLEATAFSARGPVACFGASFTHRGWAELVGKPVDEVHHRLFSPDELFPEDLARQFRAIADCDYGDRDGLGDGVAQAVRAALDPLVPNHAHFISETMSWLSSSLNPSVEDLFARLSISRRQVQRLSNRFFGAPPRRLVKRVRAVRAATLLAQPNLPDAVRDELALAYFDQSHMINDIKRYTGRTPSLLDQGKLSVQTFDPAGHGAPGRLARGAIEKK